MRLIYRGYLLLGLSGGQQRVAIFHDDEPVAYANNAEEAKRTIDEWMNAR